ncbi:MAG: N-acetyl-gamma-glutamyl-phosphate reductase [Bacteroidales bacterium]|jgi:N-acetyl-gamma-glutamyl-phosphate reductase|nr:N-acetyl-gamma-glutamyl-phosphate reductase [Bacteroidales bacterium]MDD2831073.1 N-acetyl-gamma-glutamyl-phosphate reductase [Bacteroidales bacterium]MDD3208119.1 N-acetyl-gamma-glutamyl-phosphate reductase [Bacteroidales bacterium]MDD3696839.1 N-acetyl-gamma-glutamyl-phosphate reductase [Bacteroidales bacterium]MDD5046290.1 N-acetyl-gamma-glutamyl-phosphate reductase [Bacteroidales bacterium]
MNKKINVVIAGGAGYTGGELIRLLLHHPFIKLSAVLSESRDGMTVSSIHRDLEGETDLFFVRKLPDTVIDVLFLCLGHERSRTYLKENNPDNVYHVIDLSQDFRHRGNQVTGDRRFIYGLPEICKEPAAYTGRLKSAGNVANPGCFATAITLALIPLAAEKLLEKDIHVHAITGATGAGARLSATSHFPYRDNNLAVYKAFTHQHVREIRETLSESMGSEVPTLYFIPVRGDFPRGILASVYTPCLLDQEQATNLYREYYRAHPFVHVSEQEISMKEVVNTNRCKLHIEKHGHMLHITSVLDNLLKGASGTAVQNMNLLTGLPQTAGLQLKPSVF